MGTQTCPSTCLPSTATTAELSSRTETIRSGKPHVVYFVALSRKNPPKAPFLVSRGPARPGLASPDGTLHVEAPASHSPLCWGGWTPGSSQDVEGPVSKHIPGVLEFLWRLQYLHCKHHKNSFFMLFQLETAMVWRSGLRRRAPLTGRPQVAGPGARGRARLSPGTVGWRNESRARARAPRGEAGTQGLKTRAGVHTSTLFDNPTWLIN